MVLNVLGSLKVLARLERRPPKTYITGHRVIGSQHFIIVPQGYLMKRLALEICAELEMVSPVKMHRGQEQIGNRLLPVGVPVQVGEIVAPVPEGRDLVELVALRRVA